MQSQEIRQLVQKEGKSARNLVTWSVPANDPTRANDGFTQVVKKTRRSRQRSRPMLDSYREHIKKPAHTHTQTTASTNKDPLMSSRVSEEACVVVAGQYSGKKRSSRVSKSGARVDLHARYWSYLFDNLHRAVDEIYSTCESDESVLECQEVIMMLELCRRDFEALIKRFQLFEQQQLQSKRSNLAWEVRKTTSPVKVQSRRSLSPAAPHHHLYTPSQPHNSHTNQPSQPYDSFSANMESPSTFNGGTDQASCVEAAVMSTNNTTSLTNPQLMEPCPDSRPLSARSLDFTSNEVRVVSPQLKRSRSMGKADSANQEQTNSLLPSTNYLTWADRVKGLSKPLLPMVTTGIGKSNTLPTEEVKGHAKDLEAGWIKVGSRSCSSGLKSAHNRKREKVKLSESGSRSGSSSSTEPTSVDMLTITTAPDNKDLAFSENEGVVESQSVRRSTPVHSSTDCQPLDKRSPNSDETGLLSAQDNTGPSSPEQCVMSKKKQVEPWSWSEVIADYEAGAAYRQDVCWADRCDSPPESLPDIPRSPGRAIHLHQRLSSPSRRRAPVEDVEESRRLVLEKQEKAEQHRYKLQEERTLRYKMASDKVREVKESRESRIRQQRQALDTKLQRAEMLRECHLQEIVRKAQEEDAKVSEISFINTLEAQNKKIEVLERHETHKARLQELQDERQRKREEQLAKEEAVMERKKMLECERMAKLLEQEVRRKEQEAKVELMLQERDRVREDTARDKARERERKLEARNAALQTSVQQLEKKIQQKAHESSRRYGQQLEQKKLVAVTISRHTSSDDAPKVEVYKKKKWCTVCDVGIISEVYLLSHLRGRRHQEALASLSSEGGECEAPVIIEADEEQQQLPLEKPEVVERLRAGKKRAKKIRHRMASRLKDEAWPMSAQSTVQARSRPKLQRSIRELNRQLDDVHPSTAPHPHALTWTPSQLTHIERCLGDLSRCLSLGVADDQLCFSQLGGLSALYRLLLLMNASSKRRPSDKALQYAISILQSSCIGHHNNCSYLVLSNKMAVLVDLSHQLLSEVIPTNEVVESLAGSKVTSLCGSLLGVLAGVISTLATEASYKRGTSSEQGRGELEQSVIDVISYLVSVGLIDKLSVYFGSINGPIAELPVTQLVLSAINLLVAITASMHTRVLDVFSVCSSPDPTNLMLVLNQTEFVRLMQLLYAILLHAGPPRHSSTPPQLTNHTLAIATAAIKAVNNTAILDLRMVQSCLGAEGTSLEFKHIVSYLLWYCSHGNSSGLLHELILTVGYFSVLNRDNQIFLQSGRSPTLLQLLCDLPFQYFSNPELTKLLYPTLLSACYLVEENVSILEQEISCKLLVAFLQETLSREANAETDKKVVDFSAMEHRFPRHQWTDAIKFFNR